MKMVHVVPHIDQEAAGPSYSVPRLCQALAARGHEVELTCLAARGAIPGVRPDLHREWPVLRRFAVSGSLARALHRKSAAVDIVHNHSVWSMVNVTTGLVVRVERRESLAGRTRCRRFFSSRPVCGAGPGFRKSRGGSMGVGRCGFEMGCSALAGRTETASS